MRRSKAAGLRLGIESWTQASTALRGVCRNGRRQVLRHWERSNGSIAIAALINAGPRVLTASCWVQHEKCVGDRVRPTGFLDMVVGVSPGDGAHDLCFYSLSTGYSTFTGS